MKSKSNRSATTTSEPAKQGMPSSEGDDCTMRDAEFEDMSYEELVELTLKEAKQIEDIKKKRVTILAKKLGRQGTPTDMISQKISRDLRGWVNSSYVRECLGDAYKDKKQIREQITSQRRGSTSANKDKKVLLNISNQGKQETSNELPTPKEQAVRKFDPHSPNNDVITIESLQNRLRILKQERDYFAKKLVEKSPEFPELYEEIEQLKEIESERIKHGDFNNAASLSAKNELQQKIDSLEDRINEQDDLLRKNRFESDLELKEQIIPLIIFINRVTGKAQVMVDTSKMKRSIS